MSSRNESKGPIPPRWLHCPRKAVKLIQNKFLAFKTPLSSAFDSQVPEECRFTVDMLFASLKSQKLKLGLWIDLTNTSRFYDKKSLEAYGCKYLKLQCRGHGETPSEEQTRTFVQVCKNFISYNPLEIIGVHCTHGFNRTGFLIISYLVENDGTSVDAGLVEFSTARPPGIYKADYIQELFRRYDDVEDAPDPPPRPAWCLEYDDSNVEDTDEGPSTESGDSHKQDVPSKKRKREYINKNPVFMAGIPGVAPILEERKLRGIQRRVQDICSWESTGFPGSQPVSMDEDNIRLLHEKPYMVSWKADGTRYMMMIQADGEIYFIDRDNSVFQVNGLTFPHPRDISRTIGDTLLDGEMVIDIQKDDGKQIPRYLIYDVIMYDGKDVSKLPFHPNRYQIIEREIIHGRRKAMYKERIRKEKEPFAVRLKYFWDVNHAGSVLGEKFAKQLGHEPDGLIFQPAKEPYCPGTSKEVLKWKPLSHNSVDFRLKIVTESGQGILPQKVGLLFVGGLNVPFGKMKATKQIKDLDNAIVECKIENGQWVFMRERTDKSFPNSMNTAQSVCKSIGKPITTERLIDYIDRHRFLRDDSDLMPPPSKKMR
ncbi:mRNA-capping enzyme-like [Andrena cerasifolii]|uniref:mRNA-capping enzyme-like n=1 Tax=Andrena cerasifolii TaxID=2819439 RepID=UPI004038263A